MQNPAEVSGVKVEDEDHHDTDQDEEDEILRWVFEEMRAADPEVTTCAIEAAKAMEETPLDDFELFLNKAGPVGRRAPPNPLASPKLGKYRLLKGDTKIADPALRNNPLRGKLKITISTSGILIFVFLQSLVLNYLYTGRFHDPTNSMKGPSGSVLNDLGGLNTNSIREGQLVRLFWACWMHSGWIHISMNVLSQIQFLYMLEPDWGCLRTMLLFFVSGVTGNLLSAIADPCSLTVGSSGALYGLMGAILIYCVEYWNSIPRPGCILIFTSLVVIVSFITGFTGNTDNWAHLGGLLGGFLYAAGTVTDLTCLKSKCCARKGKEGQIVGEGGKVIKRQIKLFNKGGTRQKYKCGACENVTRIICLLLLLFFVATTSYLLFFNYEFKPLGHVTFNGAAKCCCCYVGNVKTRANWHCRMCAFPPPDNAISPTYGDFEDYCAVSPINASIFHT